jgi:hypothetical protein
MITLSTLLKDDQDLQHLFTNFTKLATMEDTTKGTSTPTEAGKSLKDLMTKLDRLSVSEALTIKGGTAKEKDQWNTYCGGKVPR